MIVPRWEWRTFGDRFGTAEDRFAALTPTSVDDSDELYIVSSRKEASVKIRGGALDVKRLEQVNDEGLEQWRPVAKAEFPIAATAVAELLGGLGVALPALDRDAYDPDQLVKEVVRSSAQLRPVSVHKRRARYTFGGCMAELTDVRADSLTTRTIAVENEDPALVRTAVEELGLWSRPNVSFRGGSRRLSGSAHAGTGSSTSARTR
jgi:exopolyphosphatase / guanosine-5'-triphosphate,3'-diphosphate pyrophosphatase